MAKVKVIGKVGRAIRDLDLPDTVFAAPLKGALIHDAVLAYRAAARAGTHATKNRSDVRGGGKKPWKQKKTGRSRHGSIRSPIWRGGGTVFGPQPRDYTWGFTRRMRHGALRSALFPGSTRAPLSRIDGWTDMVRPTTAPVKVVATVNAAI